MKVPDVRRNLVPDTCTADGEGALPELGPCPHDNSCVGCRGTEMATFRFFSGEFDDIVQVCWPTLIKSSVHRGSDLELNSCLHRQPVNTKTAAKVTHKSKIVQQTENCHAGQYCGTVLRLVTTGSVLEMKNKIHTICTFAPIVSRLVGIIADGR